MAYLINNTTIGAGTQAFSFSTWVKFRPSIFSGNSAFAQFFNLGNDEFSPTHFHGGAEVGLVTSTTGQSFSLFMSSDELYTITIHPSIGPPFDVVMSAFINFNFGSAPAVGFNDNPANPQWGIYQGSITNNSTQKFNGNISMDPLALGTGSAAINLQIADNSKFGVAAGLAGDGYTTGWGDPTAPAQPAIMALNRQFGLPEWDPSFVGNSPGLIYGPTYIWFNTYIDFNISNNASAFVSIDNTGLATPAASSSIRNTFGIPQYEFRGGADRFSNNLGSGGVMTKVGTLTDTMPAPSFGP